MNLVLDPSPTLAWYFGDEPTAAADAVLSQVADEGAVVPPLWRVEVLNAFQMGNGHKPVDTAFRDTALARLSAMAIDVDTERDTQVWTTTLHVADRFRLGAYDAVYLELAQRRHVWEPDFLFGDLGALFDHRR